MTSRQTALVGALFIPLFVAALLLVDNPDGNSSDAAFNAWYSDGTNRAHLIVSAALFLCAAIAWILFVTGLRERIGGIANSIAGTGAAVTAAMLAVCGTLLAAIPAAITFGSSPVPNADLARVVPLGGYVALGLFAMPFAGLTLVAVCIGGLRAGTVPKPLAWTGIVAAVALLGSLEFFPMLALVLWVAAACAVLARRPLRVPLPATA
jgi:hypothetical protein